MLREKANDSTSSYASSLSNGLHGTYYCFRTQGPRTCFFGREHSGSNNFNMLKRGCNVFYRCHGDQCSHEPVRKLGKLTLCYDCAWLSLTALSTVTCNLWL
jgi:hypothetical protein